MMSGKTSSFEVPARANGQRLDCALRLLLPGTGRRQLDHLIKAGLVTVDGRVRPKGYTVHSGQRVDFTSRPSPPDSRADEGILQKVVVVALSADFAAVYKPAGVHTERVASSPAAAVEDVLPGLLPHPEARLLNRLDRDTSGLVLAGLTRAAGERYARMQDAGVVDKRYLAVVHGCLQSGTGFEIRRALDSAKRRKVRVLQTIDPDPLRWTACTVSACDTRLRASLIQVRIKKGRRHQIRAHLALCGHPICGDVLYGQDHTGGALSLHHQMIRFPDFVAKVAPEWAGWEEVFPEIQSAGPAPQGCPQRR